MFSWQRYIKGRGWIVQGYVENAILTDCNFEVSESGYNRANDMKSRNVHAYIYCEGMFDTFRPLEKSVELFGKRINYQPFEFKEPTFKCEGTPIDECDMLILMDGKAFKIK